MHTIKFDKAEMRKMNRKLKHLSMFGNLNRRELRKVNRRVSKIYVKKAKSMITDADQDTVAILRGKRVEIPRGTLRRSVGSWLPKGGGNAIMAGPRKGAFGKVPKYSNRDGWFAHIVEAGKAGDKSYSGPNTGVFQRAMKATAGPMRTMQFQEYKREFDKFVKK